jgi:hypothetical protein
MLTIQFWQMYQLDVYSAVTWNGIIRHRESQSTVLYPAEVDDEDITESGIRIRPRGSKGKPRSATGLNGGSGNGLGHERQSFFRGWNFVVDLYRILEHAVESLRARKTTSLSPDDPSEPVSALFDRKITKESPSAGEVMRVVGKLYDQLGDEFKGAKAMTGNVDEDVYGFQGESRIQS